jgi:hypothetical protein
MAYDLMYEGDGFIRKGPKPKKADTAGKQEPAVKVERIKKAAPVRGGITMFRFTRLIFR